MFILSRAFWTATLERAVSTAAEAAVLVLGADQLNVMQADWPTVGGFAAGGFVLTVLKALIAANVGDPGPSLANETIDPRTETERLADEYADADRRSIVAALDYDPRTVPGPDADGHVRWAEPDTKGRHEA